MKEEGTIEKRHSTEKKNACGAICHFEDRLVMMAFDYLGFFIVLVIGCRAVGRVGGGGMQCRIYHFEYQRYYNGLKNSEISEKSHRY